jgi:hypothetical protein
VKSLLLARVQVPEQLWAQVAGVVSARLTRRMLIEDGVNVNRDGWDSYW